MMITPASVVGPTYSSYYNQWKVTTIPANSTEANIQSEFLNGLNETNVTLLYNKRLQATAPSPASKLLLSKAGVAANNHNLKERLESDHCNLSRCKNPSLPLPWHYSL